jgi:hypothetical protein
MAKRYYTLCENTVLFKGATSGFPKPYNPVAPLRKQPPPAY